MILISPKDYEDYSLDILPIYESIELKNASVLFEESYSENKYVTESSSNDLIGKFRRFLATIISTIENIIETILNSINDVISKGTIKIRLERYRKKLESKKKSGDNYISAVDVEKYKASYLKYYKDLIGFYKNFEISNYRSESQIEKELRNFDKIVNEHNEDLEKIVQNRKVTKIDSMLKFIDKELSGKSEVVYTLYATKDLVRKIQSNARKLKVQHLVAGKDILPKRIGFIRRFINHIVAFVRRHVSKFISTLVFVFA